MSAPHHEDAEDLAPTATEGYKVGQKKTVDEYANLDANDESLNRWKASIGIDGAGSGAEPRVVMQELFLTSPTLPQGKSVSIKLTNPEEVAKLKQNPIVIKEGVEYNVGLKFIIENAIVAGLRYIHVVKRAGVKVDKLEQMVGSFGPKKEVQSTSFVTEESPSGMIARSGSYNVRSRLIDDDGHTYADFEWSFKIGKEW